MVRVESEGSDSDQGSEVDVVEERARGKRSTKPSAKKSAVEKENLDAKLKKLAKLQKEVARMKKPTPKNKSDDDDENDYESEEDNGPAVTGFSSSIKPLAAISIPNSQKKTPLKRIGAAASRAPPIEPRVSANAFKAVPPSVNRDHASQTIAENSDADMHAPAEDSDTDIVDVSVTRTPSLPATSASKRSNPSPSPLGPVSKKSKTTTTVTIEPPALKIPEFRAGAEVNHKRPKASDYEDVVEALILRAAFEYESLISTANAFPGTTLRHKWANQAWKNAGLDADEHYKLTDRISSLLRKRGSHIRGHALILIRPLVASTYGFKRGSDTRTVTFNQALHKKLKEGSAFHYKDVEATSGFAQNKIISEILQAVWLDNVTSHGVIFEKMFNPIPLGTLTIILTIIDFCINEWSSGQYVKAKMWEKEVLARHEVYRKDLEDWRNLNVTAVDGICRKWYQRASRNAGVIQNIEIKQTLTGDVRDRARDELEGRTGETDSEMEE